MSGMTIPVIHGAALDRPDEIDSRQTAEAVCDALTRLGHRSAVVHIGIDLAAIAALPALHPDVVFNLVEAIGGDAARAGEVPVALERLGLRYTGCGSKATDLCLSKPAMKRAMVAAGLPTPAWSMTGDGLSAAASVIVKSATEHASVGLDAASVVPGCRAGAEILARAARHGGEFFAEIFVDGREFNLSVLDGPQLLPPAETLFVGYEDGRPRIVDYDAKWIAGSHGFDNTPRRFAVAARDRDLVGELGDLARRAWTLFGLAGYARVDFRVDRAGRPWILEVNTNPCLAPDAGFAAAAAEAGLTFDVLISRIVAATAATATKAA